MRHFYGFVGLPDQWADDNDNMVTDRFFDDKEYVDYYFDDFFEMDKIFGHEQSAFGTRGLPVGHPNRTSRSFDSYNKKYGPAIVRVIKKDDLTENIHRLRELMGIIREQDEDTQPEEKDCYPSDYEPGKTYERDDLAKIFSCFAGEDKFPVSGVKEWMFPLLPPNKDNPVHHSPSYDPKNMHMGYEKPLTMEEFVEIWKLKCSGLTLENISITPEDIHQETLDFIPTKKEAYGGKRRIAFQMKRAMEDGVDSLTKDEPFVVELKEGKYKWDEGWNRLIALIELYNQGKIPKIVGKSWVATRID